MDQFVPFASALLIEDDSSHALLVRRALQGLVDGVQHVPSLAAGRAVLSGGHFDLVITDLHLQDASGAPVIEEIRALRPELPVAVLTSSTSLQDAIEAMKHGARDFVVKDFGPEFKAVLAASLRRLQQALRLEAERARLEQEMRALQLAIEKSSDGFAVSGIDGEISYSNSAFAHFVARCGGEAHAFRMLSSKVKRHDTVQQQLQHNLATLPIESVWTTEIALDDGVFFDLTLSIMGREQGAGRQGALWVRDVSEQRRRERLQRELLSTTTHDLKGPLNAILSAESLLEERAEGRPELLPLLTRIGSSARGAVHLIDEFLSARRIQEGTLILRPAPQAVRGLLEHVVDEYRTIATARSLTLSLECPDAMRPLSVDTVSFERVIGNLLSNATKFTRGGGRITVSAREEGDEIHIAVADTGAGMEASEVSRLFERFSRLERHNEVAGSGLGLFIVRSIVQAHGGRISVTSRVGEGSVFDVAFPFSPPVNERGELVALP